MLAILGNTLNQNVTVGRDACLIQLNEQHTPNLPKSTIRIYIYIIGYTMVVMVVYGNAINCSRTSVHFGVCSLGW